MLALAVAVAVSGCSTLKKFTGQRDDTILPGQREDILTPEQQTAQDPKVTRGAAAQQQAPADGKPCDPNALDCVSPIDQEAVGADSQ